MKLTAEHGFPLWEACAAFWYGWALAAAGEVTAGSAQMRSAIAANKGLGVVNQVPFLLGVLADICTQAGDPTEARDLLTEALRIVDRTQERWFEAELHRLRAEALLASSPCDSAEAEASLSHASSNLLLESQPAEKVKALLEITTNLSKTLELGPLLPKIVDSLFQVFKQADRGFIILRDESGKRLVPKVFKARRAADEANSMFSRSIVKQCMETVQALLSDGWPIDMNAVCMEIQA